jgi:hypothetical protein
VSAARWQARAYPIQAGDSLCRCSGKVCTTVCKRGTVKVEPWLRHALETQVLANLLTSSACDTHACTQRHYAADFEAQVVLDQTDRCQFKAQQQDRCRRSSKYNAPAHSMQNALARKLPFCYATMLGSHNSGITLADGYGTLDPYFQKYFEWVKFAVSALAVTLWHSGSRPPSKSWPLHAVDTILCSVSWSPSNACIAGALG